MISRPPPLETPRRISGVEGKLAVEKGNTTGDLDYDVERTMGYIYVSPYYNRVHLKWF